MKSAAVLFFLLMISTAGVAADEKPAAPQENIGEEVPGDTFDGSEVDSPADVGKPMRMPAADGLSYSDDEIQNNLPEGYKTKNMPIDKD